MRIAPASSPVETGRFAAAERRSVRSPPWATSISGLDTSIGGGFAHGGVHEFYAAETGDETAAAGLVAALAIGMSGHARPVLWLRTEGAVRASGVMQGAGWAELGGTPATCLFVLVDDAQSLLRAASDALRSGAPGVVILEGWGRMPELDLTASRRLLLAAEKSGVTLLLLRIDAEPVPSAAATRWQVAVAPSQALAANAPGMPAFDMELLRQRSGPSGLRWRLEWDRDRRIFRDAALSGTVVPVPVRRPLADSGTGPLPETLRRIA